MAIFYYKELDTGDYMEVDRSYNGLQPDMFDCRATAIARLVSSVQTTSASQDYLRKKCRRVAKRRVPRRWLQAFG